MFDFDNEPSFSRTDRVAREIQRILATLLQREVKDPRLQGVTITDCKVSKDLSVCKVYFDVLGADRDSPQVAEALAGFDKARGFLRSALGKQLRLRLTPELRFYYDEVPEKANEIDALIAKALRRDR
ncbi:30S ribosome-binding factor RbfA [Sulfurivirga sp.]|uniref:30S ribosome-binding factor RbfA n=1 Tax=Sulfurivirga sp. TaxID=2614236 RepID=UPI0025D7502F|nr:30S ribosome-binding factor RbfA [Sulfurivirga sp.]